MKLLTEDERFREYLMGFDEYRLCEEAKEYIPTEVKRKSLIESAENLSDFITDNFDQEAVDIDAPEELQQMQVVAYLMILNEHNRLHLIYHLTPHSFEYLELLNKEILN